MWGSCNWLLTFLILRGSKIALHENIVQGCGKLFHMLTILFFYRHFGMESVPDPFISYLQGVDKAIIVDYTARIVHLCWLCYNKYYGAYGHFFIWDT